MYRGVCVFIDMSVSGDFRNEEDLDISVFVVKQLKLLYCSQFSESVSIDSEKTKTLQSYLILKTLVCLGGAEAQL